MKNFREILKYLKEKDISIETLLYDFDESNQECIVFFFNYNKDEYEVEISDQKITLFVNNNLEGQKIQLDSGVQYLKALWNDL